jgi:hypothetical protein
VLSERDAQERSWRIAADGLQSHSIQRRTTANEHGLALALPETVVMARPTGVGHAITTYIVPIEGRDEWEAAARAGERPA